MRRQSVEGLELFSCGRFETTVWSRSFCSASEANDEEEDNGNDFRLELGTPGNVLARTSVQWMSPVLWGESRVRAAAAMDSRMRTAKERSLGNFGAYWSAPPGYR